MNTSHTNESAEEIMFNIYPNPASEYLKIEVPSFVDKFILIKIRSIDGRLVSSKIITRMKELETIDLNDFSNGTYSITLQADAKEIRKVIYVNK